MAWMYYDTDANLDLLAQKTTIIGYGSQVTLTSLDSGVNVIVTVSGQ